MRREPVLKGKGWAEKSERGNPGRPRGVKGDEKTGGLGVRGKEGGSGAMRREMCDLRAGRGESEGDRVPRRKVEGPGPDRGGKRRSKRETEGVCRRGVGPRESGGEGRSPV